MRHQIDTGWLLHGHRSPGQATIEHAELACDDDFLQFLTARLREEARAAVRRPSASAGLDLLHDLVSDVEDGRLPDDVTLDLVTTAYCGHPDFRPEWSAPSTLLTAERSAS